MEQRMERHGVQEQLQHAASCSISLQQQIDSGANATGTALEPMEQTQL